MEEALCPYIHTHTIKKFDTHVCLIAIFYWLFQSLCGEDHIVKGVSVHISNAAPKTDPHRAGGMGGPGGGGMGPGGGMGLGPPGQSGYGPGPDRSGRQGPGGHRDKASHSVFNEK